MRITTSGMMRDYSARLQKNFQAWNEAFVRMDTGRKYQRVSEDVSTASRVRTLESNYQRNEVYLRNIQSVSGAYTQADTLVNGITDLLSDAIETRFLNAINGTMDEKDRAIFANELRNMQEQIVADLNTSYSSRYLFSGAETGQKPFTLTNGVLYFRGLDVSDPANLADLQAMAEETMYIDIGLGMEVTTTIDPITGAPTNTVVPGTAFDAAFSALNFFGYGTDAAGNSNNIILTLGEMADVLENPGFVAGMGDELHERAQEQFKTYLLHATTLNAKAKFLTDTEDRLIMTQENLRGHITELAMVDTEYAAILHTAAQNAYLSSLKIGSTMLGQSLLDYLS